MTSTGVNVLRWSALFTGILYGIYHQGSITSRQKANERNRKLREEESLIAQAKAEYVKKTMPKDKLTPSGNVISDPDDPKFDLEAYLTMKMAEEAKG